MKLLPLACFAASAAQSGDYDYGSVDSGDDDRHYGYGSYDDYGHKNSNTWNFGGKAIGSHQSIAVALNCWPANFDYDTLMMRDPAEGNPGEHHTYGPLHVYGSEMHSRYAALGAGASFTAEDPGLRSGMGGHYAYGHSHSGGTWNDAPSEWVHYHSARHAGCLYEVNDFTYNSGSWNRIFHMWYFNGYYDRTTEANQVAANLDGVTYDPNWVHFFNAHVLPSGGTGMSTNPVAPAQTAGNSIKLVMANPQYEGLGWLNFVATYGKRGHVVGDAFQEFADSTHVTTPGAVALDTYSQINSSPHQQTEGTTGNYYYDAWMGTWEMNMDDADTWETTYDEAGGASFSGAGLSMSSFPHNEQGKDFRFNMRVLLVDANDATRKMYYFYKINTITVEFPAAVAYSVIYDGRESNTASGATMDGVANGATGGGGANAQGDGLYNVAQNNIRDNIVPPLDLGSHHDHSFGAHIASANEHHRVTGYLSTQSGHVCAAGNTNCADFCAEPSPLCAIGDLQCAAANLEEVCSTHFHITGLMNTYSERLGGQRGTYQEIWVQLQYAIGQATINDANANVAGSPDIISSPFPYLHFMAYEVLDITIACDDTNVDNGNTCNAFAAYGTHDFGWGG